VPVCVYWVEEAAEKMSAVSFVHTLPRLWTAREGTHTHQEHRPLDCLGGDGGVQRVGQWGLMMIALSLLMSTVLHLR
jgi:hypothetical protein